MTVTPNTIEAALEATRESLRAYRRNDPHFEQAIADYVDAEASLQDPAEGQRAGDSGPAQEFVVVIDIR